jgi:hypothetical protein
MAKVMTKSGKALENLKKLYGDQTALNKKILAAEKLYAAELKAETKAVAKQAKGAKPGRKPAVKKAGAPNTSTRGRPPAVRSLQV